MKHVSSIGYRRPRESGGPGQPFEPCGPWVPAFAGMTDKRLICGNHCGSALRHNESEFARPSYGRAGSVERTREVSRSRRRGEGLAYGVFYFWELSTTGEIATLAMAMSGANGGRACCGQWLGRGC